MRNKGGHGWEPGVVLENIATLWFSSVVIVLPYDENKNKWEFQLAIRTIKQIPHSKKMFKNPKRL